LEEEEDYPDFEMLRLIEEETDKNTAM